MIHHYLQKGFTIDHILSLEPTEKLFYLASMSLAFDEEAARYRAMTGGEK